LNGRPASPHDKNEKQKYDIDYSIFISENKQTIDAVLTTLPTGEEGCSVLSNHTPLYVLMFLQPKTTKNL